MKCVYYGQPRNVLNPRTPATMPGIPAADAAAMKARMGANLIVPEVLEGSSNETAMDATAIAKRF